MLQIDINYLSGIHDSDVVSRFEFIELPTSIDNRALSSSEISSLQSFETSLIMIGLGRWANAVAHITTAIEGLAKGDRLDGKLVDLINLFCSRHNLTESLRESAQIVRQRRNQFMHGSVTPRDNALAIRIYLVHALSVYKVFLEKAVSCDLYEIIWPSNLRVNLKFTMNLIKKKPQDDGMISYDLAVLVKTIRQVLSGKVTPVIYAELDTHGELLHALIRDRIDDISEYTDGTLINDLYVPCPTNCGGCLCIEVATDHYTTDKEFLARPLASAVCQMCDLLIVGEEMLREFVYKPIGGDGLKKLLSEFGMT